MLATIRSRGEGDLPLMLVSFGQGKGMCFGMTTFLLSMMLMMCSAGSHMVISEAIGSLGMRVEADLWSFVRVDVIGGMYVRIWSASVGVS